ncbi:MAG: ABC transporter ATP-binding protein [Paracoccaceae bacterium]|jgi:multiple sugar transport system ATP-binding protein|nr:ABC transporter ATP-binding protein [Paracoccaceae bacterium]
MIELDGVTRRFGATPVLHGISLAVPEGSFTSILGPSGCGKSTTLRIMAGLDRPTEGRVLLNGVDVTKATASERNVAMVFQSYALYPHLTVAENIALPLAMRHLSRLERLAGVGRLMPGAGAKRAEIGNRVRAVAAMLDLEGLLERKPAALSGGQKQRVAVGRALVRDPSVFLLDEPLSNLDARLRVQMRAELAALQARTGRAFVYVTHDQAEAMAMSTHVVVMMAGRLAQAAAPRDLYERPATREVAAFVGAHPINLLDVTLGARGACPLLPGLRVPGPAGTRVTLGLRPEHLSPAANGLSARLERVEYLGAEAVVHARLDDGTALRALAPGDWAPPAPGGAISLAVAPERVHLFHSESGARLPAAAERVAA